MANKPIDLLLVEDHADTATLYRAWLQKAPLFDYHISVVPTVAEAFRAIAAEHFDAIMLDLILPNGSGLEVLDRLMLYLDENDKHIPVLVISGLDTEDIDEEALRKRATEFRFKQDIKTPYDLYRALRFTAARHEAERTCAKLARDVDASRKLTEEMKVLHELGSGS